MCWKWSEVRAWCSRCTEREFFIDNLLVRIHRCFWWTGLAPWEFEFPFPGSLISTFLEQAYTLPGHSASVSQLEFSDDGAQAISGGKDGTV